VIYYDSREPHEYGDEDLELLTRIAELSAPYFLLVEGASGERPSNGDIVLEKGPLRTTVLAARRRHRRGEGVVLSGESGVGKSRIARWLHATGPRRGRPCEVLDCGAAGLIGPQLFGDVRPGQSGATSTRNGVLKGARGGTLLLENFDALTFEHQGRLLEYLRANAPTSGFEPPVALIATVTRSLTRIIERGLFHPDLFQAMGAREFVLSPLRHRVEDIQRIAEAEVESRGFDLPAEISDELSRRSWPGNTRQLIDVVRRLCDAAELRMAGELSADDLPEAGVAVGAVTTLNGADADERVKLAAVSHLEGVLSDLPLLPFRDVAARVYREALQRCGGNVSAAARALEIKRNTLYARLDRVGVPVERPGRRPRTDE
jgi:DNA-binding NtrC family response regulator